MYKHAAFPSNIVVVIEHKLNTLRQYVHKMHVSALQIGPPLESDEGPSWKQSINAVACDGKNPQVIKTLRVTGRIYKTCVASRDN